MAKKKLFEDILHNPARFYRAPGDVLRDRRFDDSERAAILRAWVAADTACAEQVGAALSELQDRGVNHAAQ